MDILHHIKQDRMVPKDIMAQVDSLGDKLTNFLIDLNTKSTSSGKAIPMPQPIKLKKKKFVNKIVGEW